jgi:multiple sugar transport system permease protein
MAGTLTDVVARGAGAARPLRRSLRGYSFLVPTLLIFGLFSWYPLVRGVVLAFQNDNLVAPSTWAGLANFHTVFHDTLFATAWKNTAEFVILGLLFGYGVPLIVALAISEMRHWRGFLRVLVYLPVVLPPVVSVLLWQWFYDPSSGLFNEVLRALHLPTSQWIQSSGSAMVSLVLEATWAGFGGTALIYVAALQGVSGRLYEAAELDGAGFFGRLWHITLPQMRFILLVMLLLQVIGTMQAFTEPYVMTDGGPNNATTTVVLQIYNYAFVDSNYGAAAALSLILAAVLGVLTVIYLALTRRWSQ